MVAAVACAVVVVLAIFAAAHWPYRYYDWARWVVFVTSCIAAIMMRTRSLAMALAIIVGWCFNPFATLKLHGDEWQYFDIGVAFAMAGLAAYALRVWWYEKFGIDRYL